MTFRIEVRIKSNDNLLSEVINNSNKVKENIKV